MVKVLKANGKYTNLGDMMPLKRMAFAKSRQSVLNITSCCQRGKFDSLLARWRRSDYLKMQYSGKFKIKESFKKL